MDKRFLKKKKFWISIIGALGAAGVLTASMSETALRVLQAIFGG